MPDWDAVIVGGGPAGLTAGLYLCQTGVFPLYEVEDGRYKMSIRPSRLTPVQEYLKLQGRFRHLSEETVKEIQDRVEREYYQLAEKADTA